MRVIKRFTLTTLSIFIITLSLFGETDEEKGLRISIENEKTDNGFLGEAAESEMILKNAHGDQTIRKMASITKEVEGDGDKQVITFLWPADVKDTRMLTWSHKTKDDDQWLYMPAIKRVKRISSKNKSSAFMGSEFSYEDLGSQEVEKYSHKWIKDRPLKGRECWIIERIPTSKRSGYSKLIVWVDKEYRQPLEIQYFDRKGELLKVASFKDYKKLNQWWRVHEIEMKNVQTRKTSTILWKKREVEKAYKDYQFTSNYLKE